MSCDQYSDAIAELADGTLPEAERRAVEAHLAECPSCRALAADLGRIRAAARSLEPLEAPPVVWSRIERALAAEADRAPWFRQTRWLALAASLVVIVGAAALMLRVPVAPVPAEERASNATVDDIVERIEGELKLAEQHYTTALADLEAISASDGSALDPAVTTALRQNVALVDQAIADSRAALDADPQNVPARESLFDALRRKVVLLQDTIALVGEMSRGNQAGAAEIVEGLKKS